MATDGEKEFCVTTVKGVDWRSLHDDLCKDTSAIDSVDSAVIPDREVYCCDERAVNPRNTHYHLTDAEAEALKADPRVYQISDRTIPEVAELSVIQEGVWDTTNSASGEKDNWGLIRHTSTLSGTGSPFGSFGSGQQVSDTYDYVLDGTGVDVVIWDTGIQKDHPEFTDSNGVSRVQEIDWFTASGVSGTQSGSFYTDTNGHGTHVAGTVAGKTFGWAKNARIYAMNMSGLGGTGGISTAQAFDCILGWHNAKNGSRPTVVNMSWSYVAYITDSNPAYFSFNRSTWYEVTGTHRHRGVNHTNHSYTALKNFGVTGSYGGTSSVNGTSYQRYTLPRKISSYDIDLETLIDAGIIICHSAGNSYQKQCKPATGSSEDYNNYFSFLNNSNKFYYHRPCSPTHYEGGESYYYNNTGGSDDNPTIDINPGFTVGATDAYTILDGSVYKDQKTNFSNSGDAVNIWAAGARIISSVSNNASGSTYHENSSYKQAKYNGTSMSSPQVAGMCACLMQAHPDWTPTQVQNYMTSNSQDNLYSTGSEVDYTTSDYRSILGSTGKVAYFPMNGPRKYVITEV